MRTQMIPRSDEVEGQISFLDEITEMERLERVVLGDEQGID
jgi:hypothetical protein